MSHPHILLTKSNDSCNILQTRRYGSLSPPRGRSQSNFNSQWRELSSSTTNAPSNFRQSKRTCLICKKPNHIARDCFFRGQQTFKKQFFSANANSCYFPNVQNSRGNFRGRQGNNFANEIFSEIKIFNIIIMTRK